MNMPQIFYIISLCPYSFNFNLNSSEYAHIYLTLNREYAANWMWLENISPCTGRCLHRWENMPSLNLYWLLTLRFICDLEDAECSDYRFLKCLVPTSFKYHLFTDRYTYFSSIIAGRSQYFPFTTQCRYFIREWDVFISKKLSFELLKSLSGGVLTVIEGRTCELLLYQNCLKIILKHYYLRSFSIANDAKTFLKHFSDCLFYFCSTCADAWSRNKINGR